MRGRSAGTPGTVPWKTGPYRRCGAVRGLSGGWGGRNPAAISARRRRGGFSDYLKGWDFFGPGREEGRGRRPTGASSGTATGTYALPSVCSLAGAKPIARSRYSPQSTRRPRFLGSKSVPFFTGRFVAQHGFYVASTMMYSAPGLSTSGCRCVAPSTLLCRLFF